MVSCRFGKMALALHGAWIGGNKTGSLLSREAVGVGLERLHQGGTVRKGGGGGDAQEAEGTCPGTGWLAADEERGRNPRKGRWLGNWGLVVPSRSRSGRF